MTTTSLRHRTADGVAVASPNNISATASKDNKFHRKSSNRNLLSNSRRLLLLVTCVLCFIVVVYMVLLFYVTDNANANANANGKQQIRTGGGGGGKVASPHQVQLQGQELLKEEQKHVSKPLSELIPRLQSLKEQYPAVERGSRSDKTLFKRYNKKNQVQLAKKRDKKGNVVYNPITSVKKEDLEPMGYSKKNIAALGNITHDEAIKGRERLVEIMNEAGIVDIDPEAIAMLPKWSSVQKLYGDKPVVLGLERCEEFRTQFDSDDASIGPAGMFNTGTNPFAMYISNNCRLPKNKKDRAGGTRWQVPWGKHMLASRKLTNTAGHDFKVNKTNVMPIVLVRDPYTWMQSMCKHGYEARWPHNKLCPNLAKDKLLSNGEPDMVPLKVKYKPPAEFPSLAHYWVEWYKEYLEADYPRLIVRFEDIQYHAKELIETVCQCAGAVPRNDDALFRYVVDSAKWGAAHKSKSNMISAMVKYGSDEKRFTGMREADWLVAKEAFTPELMELFGYEMPEHLTKSS